RPTRCNGWALGVRSLHFDSYSNRLRSVLCVTLRRPSPPLAPRPATTDHAATAIGRPHRAHARGRRPRPADAARPATALAAVAAAAGAPRAAAGVAYFYPFLTEFNHGQRDVWMTLPVTAACLFRLRRVRDARATPTTDAAVFRTAFLEGMVWALAFWIKPH